MLAAAPAITTMKAQADPICPPTRIAHSWSPTQPTCACGHHVCASLLLLLICGCSRGGLSLRKLRLVVLITQVSDVHPRMRHLVDAAVSATHPLIRIRVVLVGGG